MVGKELFGVALYYTKYFTTDNMTASACCKKNSPKFFSLQLGADDSYLNRIKKLTRAAFYFKIKNLLYKINQHFKIFKNVFYSNNLHTALPFAKKLWLVPCVTRQIVELK